MEVKGRIHSIQSLGAVDGPGLRCVVFMQGCPLRCAYCHNPDTWDFAGGDETTPAALAARVMRLRPYWGQDGGVTLSGGEPLAQPEFARAFFAILQGQGVHTALDTSGAGSLEVAREVLAFTNLVLADIKFPTEQGYVAHCGGSLAHTVEFLHLCGQMGVPVWARHVVAPGLTDTAQSMAAVKALAESCPTLERIEWLPFQNLCVEKYRELGIPFPMGDTPNMDAKALAHLAAGLI